MPWQSAHGSVPVNVAGRLVSELAGSGGAGGARGAGSGAFVRVSTRFAVDPCPCVSTSVVLVDENRTTGPSMMRARTAYR
jgi:hypothetical protein